MQTIRVTELARPITPLPSLLATRVVGKRFWISIEACLRASTDQALKISFAGVELMDASFADEVFGTLASLRARREVQFSPLVISELNDTCTENLYMALDTRPDREPGDRERLRNCVLPVIIG